MNLETREIVKYNNSDWTIEDEQNWQSLLLTEPARKTSQNSANRSNEEMITVNRNNQPQATNSTPKGVQFLSPRHVTTAEGFVATIYKVTIDQPDNFGNPYIVYFKSGADKFSKGFKPTSENLISLVDLFGDDEKKWVGVDVLINKKVDDNSERLIFLPAPKRSRR